MLKAGIDQIIYSTVDDLPDDVTCEHIKSKAAGMCTTFSRLVSKN